MKLDTLPQIPPTLKIRFKNILFATDLGAASEQAKVYAALLSRFFGAHLYALHVDASQHIEGAAPDGDPLVKIGELKRFFQGSGVPFTMLLEQGHVREALNRVADDHDIDLILLGSHDRHGASYLFMGSVSEDVSRSCTRPVITVGPKACPGFDKFSMFVYYSLR
jgi:nucleotide-binding universal stress UspA family protein